MGRAGGGEENGLKNTIISAKCSRIADEAEVVLGASEGVVASALRFCCCLGMIIAMDKSGRTQIRQAILEANACQMLFRRTYQVL